MTRVCVYDQNWVPLKILDIADEVLKQGVIRIPMLPDLQSLFNVRLDKVHEVSAEVVELLQYRVRRGEGELSFPVLLAVDPEKFRRRFP